MGAKRRILTIFSRKRCDWYRAMFAQTLPPPEGCSAHEELPSASGRDPSMPAGSPKTG